MRPIRCHFEEIFTCFIFNLPYIFPPDLFLALRILEVSITVKCNRLTCLHLVFCDRRILQFSSISFCVHLLFHFLDSCKISWNVRVVIISAVVWIVFVVAASCRVCLITLYWSAHYFFIKKFHNEFFKIRIFIFSFIFNFLIF